jgi:xanthine dehydrogenase YagS FAD-binding subunit
VKNFEYARPTTEAEALQLLAEREATAVLAGGTDLVTLLQRELLPADRVVDVKEVATWRGIAQGDDGGLLIGALTTLEEIVDSPLTDDYPSLLHVADGIRAIQMQQTGTLGGDLCHLPNCWYFRNGHGLLGIRNGESLVATGDNRYHAILGNAGPAKYVSASRFAPAAIAWGARVRIAGPQPDREEWLPLEYLYRTPTIESQGVTVLERGQLVTHVWLPPSQGYVSASYEVLATTGLDWPLAAAACTLDVADGIVRDARIVLGHVAPTPWVSREAVRAILGHSVNAATAERAADAAVVSATPLSKNESKVQMARTAVKRAILRATGQLEGGL